MVSFRQWNNSLFCFRRFNDGWFALERAGRWLSAGDPNEQTVLTSLVAFSPTWQWHSLLNPRRHKTVKHKVMIFQSCQNPTVANRRQNYLLISSSPKRETRTNRRASRENKIVTGHSFALQTCLHSHLPFHLIRRHAFCTSYAAHTAVQFLPRLLIA